MYLMLACVSNKPELRSRPGLNARLLTVGESLSQQMVLETLALKLPSNLNTHKEATFENFRAHVNKTQNRNKTKPDTKKAISFEKQRKFTWNHKGTRTIFKPVLLLDSSKTKNIHGSVIGFPNHSIEVMARGQYFAGKLLECCFSPHNGRPASFEYVNLTVCSVLITVSRFLPAPPNPPNVQLNITPNDTKASISYWKINTIRKEHKRMSMTYFRRFWTHVLFYTLTIYGHLRRWRLSTEDCHLRKW